VDYAAREAEALAKSTSAACSGDSAAAEGAYKLLRNAKVDPDDIGESGFQATVRAAKDFGVLLAIEDSTTLGYRHSVAAELGSLGGKSDAKTRGFWVHSVLLVAPEPKQVVGLVHQQRWIRSESETEDALEKESERWRFASECVAERMGEAMARVISVCDREADIYEYLSFKVERHERFVVRAKHDRSIERSARLWETMQAIPSLGVIHVQLPQRGGRQARSKREATLTVRVQMVELKAPQHLASRPVASVKLWAVYAREEAPPPGEEALEWMLLTTEDASKLASAARILGYYGARWKIEDFHKAWKSGTGVEERRMQCAENLERMAVILAFLAVRMLQLSDAYDITPEAPCDTLLCDDEWRVLWLKTEKKPVPKDAPNVAWAYKAIARLGGWLDTKRTGRAGWAAICKGWLKLSTLVDGYRLANKST
jgi:hypothetical protein